MARAPAAARALSKQPRPQQKFRLMHRQGVPPGLHLRYAAEPKSQEAAGWPTAAARLFEEASRVWRSTLANRGDRQQPRQGLPHDE
jgi:hypothetical protein